VIDLKKKAQLNVQSDVELAIACIVFRQKLSLVERIYAATEFEQVGNVVRCYSSR